MIFTLPPERTNIKKLFDTLQENTVYKVYVAMNANNLIHISLLWKGFHNGAYSYLMNNTYDDYIDPANAYFIKVIKKLDKIK